MDVGGVHNETGDEGDEDDEDDHALHPQQNNFVNNITLIPSSSALAGVNDNSMSGGGRSLNN